MSITNDDDKFSILVEFAKNTKCTLNTSETLRLQQMILVLKYYNFDYYDALREYRLHQRKYGVHGLNQMVMDISKKMGNTSTGQIDKLPIQEP